MVSEHIIKSYDEELRRLDPDEVYAETVAPFAAPHGGAKRAGGGRRRGAEVDGHGTGGRNAAGGGSRK